MKSSQRLLARQWQIIQLLGASRRGLRISQIGERVESSRATVYRDLALLQHAGVPIVRDSLNGESRYRMLRPPELPSLTLTAVQLSALHLARAELEPLAGTGLVQELDALLARHRPPEPQASFHFAAAPPPAPPARAQVLGNIERALRARRRALIDYRSGSQGGKLGTRLVEPLLLSVARGEPYLLAYCVERREERTYKLARITRFEVTQERATYRPAQPARRAFDHSIKAWAGAPHPVSIRLDADVAWLASEYPIIAGQRAKANRDGSVTVHANVAGTVEAMRWVLSWGGAAEALSPPDLREQTRSELARALAKYEGPGVARAKRRPAPARAKKASHAS